MGLPTHMVPLPHMPLVVTSRSPVGIGVIEVEVLVGGCWAEVLVLVGGTWGVDVDVGVGVVDVDGSGAGRGQPQEPYCSWQSNNGWQWSIDSPQKP